MAAFDW